MYRERRYVYSLSTYICIESGMQGERGQPTDNQLALFCVSFSVPFLLPFCWGVVGTDTIPFLGDVRA